MPIAAMLGLALAAARNGVDRSYATDAEGSLTLPFEDSLLAQNPTVTLSISPVRATFRE
jgi:hypothetical protein